MSPTQTMERDARATMDRAFNVYGVVIANAAVFLSATKQWEDNILFALGVAYIIVCILVKIKDLRNKK